MISVMKQIILVAGAAALAFTGAAAHAKPPHAGQGRGQGAAMSKHGRDMAPGWVGQRGFGSQYGYGARGCPPGLAKKNPQCMPPGQHKKMFNVGQRVPFGYRGLLGYDGLPQELRFRYGSRIDPYSRYIYRDDYLYRVDPATMMVREILRTIL